MTLPAPNIVFVHGPPGTGKTPATYLSKQARRAVEAHGENSVAIASLTRAAAAEIAGRDTGIPEELVGTLHAHCYRAQHRPELAETPEGIRAWNDAHPTQALSRGSNQLEDTIDGGASQAAGDPVHHQVMMLRAAMIPRERWTIEQRAHDADWADWKKQTARVDFTDLIEREIAEGGGHPSLPKVLLFDEAQDFSRLELTLAAQWAAETGKDGTTVIVGDPDQAIYEWRGADPAALAGLPYTGERALAQSYRVPAAVNRLARQWVQQIASRRDVDWKPTSLAGDVSASRVALRVPEQLVEQIDADLADGKTVMVLATCGYMLGPLLHVLRDQGVPFHNPYRITEGRWNPMRAAGRLKAFLRADERVWGARARCWTWDDLRLWTEPLQAKGYMSRGAKTLIEAKCASDRFGEHPQRDAEVPLDVLPGLFGAGLWHRFMRGDVDLWESGLRAKEKPKMAYPLTVLRKRGHEKLAADPRVTVGTVHSVKGGEADVLYVAPDLSVQGYWHGWHPGGPGRDAIVRLMYVALTRARERVVLLAPSGAEHVPGELLEVEREALAA